MAKKRSSSTGKRRRGRRTSFSNREPLWTLERDGITHSGLTAWEECPEQFALSYIEGLQHVRINEPMEFGSLFHLCLEHRGKLSPIEAMMPYRETAVQTHKNNQDYINALDHLIHQVNAIFPAYEKTYPLRKEPKVAHSERSFSIPINVLGVDFCMRGKIDSEIHTKGKKLGLKEVKTKSTIDKEKIRYLLKCDLQTLIYLWAMRKEHGHCPTKLLYDVVKRPTLLVTKRETLKQHYERVAEHALTRANDYFFRWTVDPITDADLDKFEETLLMPLLRCFVSWWLEVRHRPFNRFESPLHHLNLKSLSDPWRKSDFYDYLVLGQTNLYTKKSSPHPELSA